MLKAWFVEMTETASASSFVIGLRRLRALGAWRGLDRPLPHEHRDHVWPFPGVVSVGQPLRAHGRPQ